MGVSRQKLARQDVFPSQGPSKAMATSRGTGVWSSKREPAHLRDHEAVDEDLAVRADLQRHLGSACGGKYQADCLRESDAPNASDRDCSSRLSEARRERGGEESKIVVAHRPRAVVLGR